MRSDCSDSHAWMLRSVRHRTMCPAMPAFDPDAATAHSHSHALHVPSPQWGKYFYAAATANVAGTWRICTPNCCVGPTWPNTPLPTYNMARASPCMDIHMCMCACTCTAPVAHFHCWHANQRLSRAEHMHSQLAVCRLGVCLLLHAESLRPLLIVVERC